MISSTAPGKARPGLKAVAGQFLRNRPFMRLLWLAPFIAYAQIAMTTFFVLFLTDHQRLPAALMQGRDQRLIGRAIGLELGITG